MKNKSWKKDLQYENAFSIYKKFNSTFYKLTIQLQYHGKTIKYWVFLSSGKKEKSLIITKINRINLMVELKHYYGLKKKYLVFMNFL